MKTMFAAALALSLMSSTAFAAPNDARGPQRQQQSHQQQGQHQQNQNGQYQGPKGQQSRPQQIQQTRPQVQPTARKVQYDYQGRRYDAVRGPAWKAPKGYNAQRHWNRGDRLPDTYRGRSYVVDYRAYHLNQPPRGYQWVRVNNDVMLVAITNGLIAQVVFSMFY